MLYSTQTQPKTYKWRELEQTRLDMRFGSGTRNRQKQPEPKLAWKQVTKIEIESILQRRQDGVVTLSLLGIYRLGALGMDFIAALPSLRDLLFSGGKPPIYSEGTSL
jgi:hypothetical protein